MHQTVLSQYAAVGALIRIKDVRGNFSLVNPMVFKISS